MTLIVASVWGGRVSIVADRRISKVTSSSIAVVEEEAAKILTVYCADALCAITYTGIATVHGRWMDQTIANCLTMRTVEPAMIQPGSFFLGRPAHEILRNLAFNLPIRLRGVAGLSSTGLTLAVAGWHLRPRRQPFVAELTLTSESTAVGGSMKVKWYPVAKHFRHFPSGLWMQAWGDDDTALESTLRSLENTTGYTHDDVERFVVQAVLDRAQTTRTVGGQCLAVQLDPARPDAHIQFTYYPSESARDPHSFLSGWVMAPTSIHTPTRENTRGGAFSDCGQYVHGGYSDPNAGLFVRTRLPTSAMKLGGPLLMSYEAERPCPPPA